MENVINVKSNIVLTENNSYRLVDTDSNQVGVVVFQDGEITVYHQDNSSKKYPNVNDFMDYLNDEDLSFMSMTSGNHRWKKYNPNPEDKNTSDCSIRAYCAAFKIDWNKAYDIASKYGQKASDYLLCVQEMTRAGYSDTAGMAELSTLAQSAGDMTAELANQYLIASDMAFGYGGNVEKLNALLDSQNQINKMVC